jgi:predicted RND superfamily exporter protein
VDSPSRLARAFLAVEQFSRQHHRLVILTALAVFAAGTAVSLRLEFRTDVMDLLPRNEPAVWAFREVTGTFGTLDVMPIAIDSPNGKYEAEDYEEFADDLARRLRLDPAIATVDSGIAPDSPLITHVQESLPLYLDSAGLDELRQRLRDDEIRATVADDRRLLETVPAPELKELLRRDPLRVSSLLLRRFTGSKGASAARWMGGRVVSEDGRGLLLLVRPAKPAQDVTSTGKVMVRVREAVAAARDALAKDDPELPQPRVMLGGRYAIAEADTALILGDIAKTMTFSFLGVVGLYLFCYRRFGAVLYSVAPLLLGQVLTFTLARLAYGNLNSATATSAGLLMGLGTDFTIVMYARYVEERRAGRTIDEASKVMMGETALGVYTGALTSAGTFGALLATSFIGLRQFGVLVGAGILLCLMSILLLLPALVVALESKRERTPRLYVHSFGFERLIPLARRRPVAVVVVCLVVTAVAVPFALQLRLSEKIDDLRSADNEGVRDSREIARRFGLAETDPNYVMVVSSGTDPGETAARARRVEGALARLRDDGRLSRVESLGTLVPSPEAQERNRGILLEGGPDFDPDRVEATLRAALRDAGLREEGFATGIEALRRMLRPTAVVTSDDLAAHGGADLLSRFVRHDGGRIAYASYAFGPIGDDEVAAIRAEDPEAVVAGVPLLSRALKRVLRHDVAVCLGLGFVIVALLLALDFRSWTLAGLALAQLVVGLTWMLGAMAAAGIKLTMINAFAAALLMGVGIDYGIHILHRLRGKDAGTEEAIAETGKAVAMAAMTNVVGFGVLLASSYPGLKGLGQAAVLGSVGCLLTALLLLPALDILVARASEKRGASAK